MSNTNDPQDTPPSDVRIRRAPRVSTFLILGGGIGAVVTFILTAIFPVDPAVGFGALFGYFALFGVTGGVLLGALVAIVLDRRADRNARTVSAVHEVSETDRPDAALRPEAPAAADAPDAPVIITARSDEPSAPPAAAPSTPLFDQDDPPAPTRS